MEEGKEKTAITVAVLEEDMARTMESYLVGICVDDYMISRFEFDGKFLFIVSAKTTRRIGKKIDAFLSRIGESRLMHIVGETTFPENPLPSLGGTL